MIEPDRHNRQNCGGLRARRQWRGEETPSDGGTAYWYRRARKAVCRTSLDEEWAAIAGALLKRERGAGA